MNPSEHDNLARREEKFWWYRGMDAITFDLLERYLPASRNGFRILDAGCGTGRSALRLRDRYQCEVDGIDLEPRGLAHAAARGFRNGVVGDIGRLPFADQAYGLVVSLDSIVYFPKGEEGVPLREFHRVLRPNGCLLIRTSAHGFLRSRHSVYAGERQRLTMSRLLAQCRTAGFSTLFATYVNSLLLPVALVKFRLVEPLTRAPVRSGIEDLPAWLDRWLGNVLALERKWLASGRRFPIGQSIIWIGRRTA
jgi:SAM-dependent methyltransferase